MLSKLSHKIQNDSNIDAFFKRVHTYTHTHTSGGVGGWGKERENTKQVPLSVCAQRET